MTDRIDSPRAPGWPLFLVIVTIVSVNAMSVSVVMPILPSLAAATGADAGTTQLVLSGYLISLAAGQILVGVLADRFGRRPVLIAGMILFVVGAAIPAFTDSIAVMIAARMLQGFGGSAGTVVGRAIVRDVFDRDRAASAYGWVTMGLAVAPMFGPAVGGLINDLVGWRAVFVIVALIGLAVLAAGWRFLPETITPEHRANAGAGLVRNIAQLLGQPAFWSHTLVIALSAGCYFAFLGGAPFLATGLLDMSATTLGLYLAFVSIGFFIGNSVSGLVSVRAGIPAMMNLGNGIVLVTLLASAGLFAAGWVNAWTLFVPVAFVGLGNGISMPSAVAGSVSVRPDLAGTASGVVGTLQFGAGAIATAVAGAMVAEAMNPLVMVAIMGVLATGAAAMGLWASVAHQPERA